MPDENMDCDDNRWLFSAEDLCLATFLEAVLGTLEVTDDLCVDRGSGPGFGPGADLFRDGRAWVLPFLIVSGRLSQNTFSELVILSAARLLVAILAIISRPAFASA